MRQEPTRSRWMGHWGLVVVGYGTTVPEATGQFYEIYNYLRWVEWRSLLPTSRKINITGPIPNRGPIGSIVGRYSTRIEYRGRTRAA